MIVVGIVLVVMSGVIFTGKCLDGKKHTDAILIAGSILLFAAVFYIVTNKL